MLMRLKGVMNEMVEVVDEFNQFILRKDVPQLAQKINLGCFDIVEMQKLANIANDHLIVTQNHNHHVFIGRNPPKFNSGDRSGRVVTYLTYPETKTRVSIQYTAVVYFLNPAKCKTPRNNKTCDKRHRTVYEFVEDHPECSVHNVHISHLCHFASCFNPRHLIIETSVVNFNRNRCRRNCTCGGVPQCFEDSE